MDPRHSDLNNHNQAFRGNYPFNDPSQSNQYNNFLQADSEPVFNNTWDPESYADPQDAIQTFGQGNQSWNTNTFQDANYAAPDYGIQDRPSFDQLYSRVPASFDYSGFKTHAQQTLSTPAYDPRLGVQVPTPHQSQYTFPNSQGYPGVPAQNQTISPQALQHYPSTYSQAAHPKPQQVRINLRNIITS